MITSVQNQQIKWLQQLEKPKVRKAENKFLIEGTREVHHAATSGFTITEVYYCDDIVAPDVLNNLRINLRSAAFIDISKAVFEKLAYRESSEGVLAVAEMRDLLLNDLVLPSDALVLVIESVEKPGNLGAILRTADAVGLDAVIVADVHTDIFNPNVIRSSLGTVFTCNIAIGSNEEVFSFLKKNNFSVYGAALGTEHFYHQICYNGNCSVIMGTESTGLSKFWLEKSDQLVKIPMLGKIDSLNVSVSAAVICFEAMRQRGFK